jgi:hypothetical protein
VKTSCDIPAAVGAFLRALYRVVLGVVRWNHRKRIRGTNQNMGWAVYDAVDESAGRTVNRAVSRAVYGALDAAVGEAVHGSLGGSARRDPPHPALSDFLSAGEGRPEHEPHNLPGRKFSAPQWSRP